uniref:Uncharacterized protein n=1 Tax=Tanacetum cinerariifolium TaxID=118510 RepID=A0A6L2KXA6_TANCI|nr:hypothetical protein [Tanacetum cinerariifolium]
MEARILKNGGITSNGDILLDLGCLKREMEARILKNGGITSNGDPNEETRFSFVDLAKKIKNIDGKVLRKAVRGDVVTRASHLKVVTFETDLVQEGVETNRVNAAALVQHLTSNVVNASVNRGTNAKAAAGGTSATVGDVISQPVIVNKSSFAAVMGTQPVHKVVNLSELRNEEIVEGAAVALPLVVVEEVNASGSGANATKSKMSLKNSFSALNDDEDSEWQNTQQVLGVLNESDSDVDEVITFDDRGGNLKIT